MTEQEFIEKFKQEGFELYKTEDLKPKLYELEILKEKQNNLPSYHQPNDKVILVFGRNTKGYIWDNCVVDAVKFDNHGKVYYDLIVETPEGDTFIDNVDSVFVEKYV